MTTSAGISDVMQGLTIRDLRAQCRARGISPAGGVDTLKDRLADNMLQTNDMSIKAELVQDTAIYGGESTLSSNNYQRPGGQQNLGNRITDRPTSRVLAPPGGVSQVSLGGQQQPAAGRRSHAVDALQTSSARVMHTGNEVAAESAREALQSAQGNKKFQSLSQVAFGDHQLPSYVTQHGEETATAKYGGGAVAMNDLVQKVDALTKSMSIKDLRGNLRARGLSPAGGEEALRRRLKEHMLDTGDVSVVVEEQGANYAAVSTTPIISSGPKDEGISFGTSNNNYTRPGGAQNVGNFLTDRPSSRVLAPPGGRSQIHFG